MVIDLVQRTLQVTLALAGPILLAGMLVGLVVSLVQAVTSIQEATLTFLPKMAAAGVVLLLALPWMLDVAVRFAAGIFGGLGQFAR